MKWKLSVICLTLSVMACGAPVTAAMIYPSVGSAPVPVNMDTAINTTMSTGVNMVVCNSGGLYVRPAAGDFTTYDRTLEDGDSVTVILSTRTVTDDMALWYELTDGGWVNGKYLCEVE